MNPNDPNIVLLGWSPTGSARATARRARLRRRRRRRPADHRPGTAGDPPTEDVDLIVHAAVLADYHRVEQGMRERGFVQDMTPGRPDLPLASVTSPST